MTYCLQNSCSTTELRWHLIYLLTVYAAVGGTPPEAVAKLLLYQLS